MKFYSRKFTCVGRNWGMSDAELQPGALHPTEFAEGAGKWSAKTLRGLLSSCDRNGEIWMGRWLKRELEGVLDDVRETLVAKIEAQFREVRVLLINTADQQTPQEWWWNRFPGTRNEGRGSQKCEKRGNDFKSGHRWGRL